MHPFFNDINWGEAKERKLKPPKPKSSKLIEIGYKRIRDKIETNGDIQLEGRNFIVGWNYPTV